MRLLISFEELEVRAPYGVIRIKHDNGRYFRETRFRQTGLLYKSEVEEKDVAGLLKSYPKSYRILR